MKRIIYAPCYCYYIENYKTCNIYLLLLFPFYLSLFFLLLMNDNSKEQSTQLTIYIKESSYSPCVINHRKCTKIPFIYCTRLFSFFFLMICKLWAVSCFIFSSISFSMYVHFFFPVGPTTV